MNNNQNNNNQNIKKGNKTIKKNREEAKASIMNLEKLKMEYSLQLNAYKQAIADYINYLQQNAETPCSNYSADTTGISQVCYSDIWQKSGCGGGTAAPNASSSWASSQTLNGLINDSWLWATETDYNHRMGCYGNPGNPYIIIGVGDDSNIYSRQGLDAPWEIINDNSNGNIATIFTGSDGKLYGTINKNNDTIVYKNNWSDSTWSQSISGTCCVLGAAMGQNGAIVGIGTDHTLYTKPNLTGAWTQTASAGEWCGYITIAPDGSVFVVGSDNNIWKKNNYQTLSSESWQSTGQGGVIAITIAPDGTLIGVGSNQQLYSIANYTNLPGEWTGPYNSENNSGSVTSITTVSNPNYNSSNYNTTTAPDFSINSPPLTTMPGKVFWGSGQAGSQSVYTGGTQEQCQALCSSTTNCSGATFNPTAHGQPMCWLRSGEGQVVPGLDTDVAIIPESQKYLLIIESINTKLISTNQQIQNVINQSQPVYNSMKTEGQEQNKELIQNYMKLVAEREKIAETLKSYEDLDKSEQEGQMRVSQKQYSYILLSIVAIGVIFILYKFSGVLATQSQGDSQIYNQTGGEIPQSTYYVLLIIIILIILFNYYSNIKQTATSASNSVLSAFGSAFGSFGNFFSLNDN
jgi:hypothetical protein